jgi:hypothetical protein
MHLHNYSLGCHLAQIFYPIFSFIIITKILISETPMKGEALIQKLMEERVGYTIGAYK